MFVDRVYYATGKRETDKTDANADIKTYPCLPKRTDDYGWRSARPNCLFSTRLPFDWVAASDGVNYSFTPGLFRCFVTFCRYTVRSPTNFILLEDTGEILRRIIRKFYHHKLINGSWFSCISQCNRRSNTSSILECLFEWKLARKLQRRRFAAANRGKPEE